MSIPIPLTLIPVPYYKEDQTLLLLLTLRAESAMWFDFGSSVTSSASGSLAGTVLAVDDYLACFV